MGARAEITPETRGTRPAPVFKLDLRHVRERLARTRPHVKELRLSLGRNRADLARKLFAETYGPTPGDNPLENTKFVGDMFLFERWFWKEVRVWIVACADSVKAIVLKMHARYLGSDPQDDIDLRNVDLDELYRHLTWQFPFIKELVPHRDVFRDGSFESHADWDLERQKVSLTLAQAKDFKELRHKTAARHPVALVIEKLGVWQRLHDSAEKDRYARRAVLAKIVREAVDYLRRCETSIRSKCNVRELGNPKEAQALVDSFIDAHFPKIPVSKPEETFNLRDICEEFRRSRIPWSTSDYLEAALFVVGMVALGLMGAGLGATLVAGAIDLLEAGLVIAKNVQLRIEEKDFETLDAAAVVDHALNIAPKSADSAIETAFAMITVMVGLGMVARAKLRKVAPKSPKPEKPPAPAKDPDPPVAPKDRGNLEGRPAAAIDDEQRGVSGRSHDRPVEDNVIVGADIPGVEKLGKDGVSLRALRRQLVGEKLAQSRKLKELIEQRLEIVQQSLDALKAKLPKAPGPRKKAPAPPAELKAQIEGVEAKKRTLEEALKKEKEVIKTLDRERIALDQALSPGMGSGPLGYFFEQILVQRGFALLKKSNAAAIDAARPLYKEVCSAKHTTIKEWPKTLQESADAVFQRAAKPAIDGLDQVHGRPPNLPALKDKTAPTKWQVTVAEWDRNLYGYELPWDWREPGLKVNVGIVVRGPVPPDWREITAEVQKRVAAVHPNLSADVLFVGDFP